MRKSPPRTCSAPPRGRGSRTPSPSARAAADLSAQVPRRGAEGASMSNDEPNEDYNSCDGDGCDAELSGLDFVTGLCPACRADAFETPDPDPSRAGPCPYRKVGFPSDAPGTPEPEPAGARYRLAEECENGRPEDCAGPIERCADGLNRCDVHADAVGPLPGECPTCRADALETTCRCGSHTHLTCADCGGVA